MIEFILVTYLFFYYDLGKEVLFKRKIVSLVRIFYIKFWGGVGS